MPTPRSRSTTRRWMSPKPNCSTSRWPRWRRCQPDLCVGFWHCKKGNDMTTLIDRYFETLTERLKTVQTTQAAAIEKAAEACAKSIAAGKLAFTFGTGHGALPALESFP